MTSLRRLLFAGDRRPGIRTALDFLEEFDRGDIPRTVATTAAADFFRRVLGGEPPDKALGLPAKRGRPIHSLSDSRKQHRRLLEFIEKELYKHPDPPPRGVTSRVLTDAEARFHLGLRRIQKIWRVHRAPYRLKRAMKPPATATRK